MKHDNYYSQKFNHYKNLYRDTNDKLYKKYLDGYEDCLKFNNDKLLSDEFNYHLMRDVKSFRCDITPTKNGESMKFIAKEDGSWVVTYTPIVERDIDEPKEDNLSLIQKLVKKIFRI